MRADRVDGAHPHHVPAAHLLGKVRRLPRPGTLRAAAEGGHGGGRTRPGHGNQIVDSQGLLCYLTRCRGGREEACSLFIPPQGAQQQ